MPRSRRARNLVLIAAGAALGGAAVPAAVGAQQPATPVPPTVTAIGAAQAKPVPADRRDEASIRKAVEAASAKALPLAVADARAHAAELAAAAGVSLGALVSIADTPVPGFQFVYAAQNGTFGNNRFCAKVRSFKTIVGKNGSRRRVALKRTHKVCRVPPIVSASVTLTYAIA